MVRWEEVRWVFRVAVSSDHEARKPRRPNDLRRILRTLVAFSNHYQIDLPRLVGKLRHPVRKTSTFQNQILDLKITPALIDFDKYRIARWLADSCQKKARRNSATRQSQCEKADSELHC